MIFEFFLAALKTPNARQYNYFEFRNGVTMFDVKAAHDAHIVFSGDENEANPVIEVSNSNDKT